MSTHTSTLSAFRQADLGMTARALSALTAATVFPKLGRTGEEIEPGSPKAIESERKEFLLNYRFAELQLAESLLKHKEKPKIILLERAVIGGEEALLTIKKTQAELLAAFTEVFKRALSQELQTAADNVLGNLALRFVEKFKRSSSELLTAGEGPFLNYDSSAVLGRDLRQLVNIGLFEEVRIHGSMARSYLPSLRGLIVVASSSSTFEFDKKYYQNIADEKERGEGHYQAELKAQAKLFIEALGLKESQIKEHKAWKRFAELVKKDLSSAHMPDFFRVATTKEMATLLCYGMYSALDLDKGGEGWLRNGDYVRSRASRGISEGKDLGHWERCCVIEATTHYDRVSRPMLTTMAAMVSWARALGSTLRRDLNIEHAGNEADFLLVS